MSAQKKRSSSDSDSEQAKCPKTTDWIDELNERGYTVIPNVLNESECDAALTGLKSFMSHLGRDLTQTHDLSNGHGIYQHYGVGQSQAIWDVRTNAAVAKPFEEIYGTNDLQVSSDGFCFMRAGQQFRNSASWLHLDQSSRHTGRRCIQGYVNVLDSSDERTGSLLVLPGSHLKFASFFKRFPEMRGTKNWCKLKSDEQRAFFDAAPTRVHGPRGSLVLWDSRLVHQNIGPSVDPHEQLPRCVIYICFQPRSWCSDADMRKRQTAFVKYQMTSHWPSLHVSINDAQPRRYGPPKPGAAPVPAYTDRVESPRMLELAGVTPMCTAPVFKRAGALTFEI